MRTHESWKSVISDEPNLLERVTGLLNEHGFRYCVIGGQAVSSYVEPVVSLDLDLAVAPDQFDAARNLLESTFYVRRYEPWLSISMAGSDFRVQLQTDPDYEGIIGRAKPRRILGMELPVASLEDLVRCKVDAALDPKRRASKRQKDLADIARLLEVYPQFRERLPEEIRSRLIT